MMKEFKISDLFNHCGTGKISSIDKCNNGIYPCISGTINNNGITKYIDTYDYDGVYITIPAVSDIFKCYVQHGKFAARSSVNVLNLKPEYKYLEPSLGLIAFIITLHIETAGYSYHGCNLTRERLVNEVIELPVVVRGLTEQDYNNIINGLTSTSELVSKPNNYTYELNGNLLNNFVYTCLM